MEKQEWEMQIAEPSPQPWQYKAAAISWLAVAVQRLQDTVFQLENFASR